MEKHLLTLCGLILMALGHILIWKIQSFNITRTHHWLSFGAGASVAYVFVHVLPEIGVFQQKYLGYESHNHKGSFISHHLYFAALCGVFFLYFLDYMENRFEDRGSQIPARDKYFMRISLIKLMLYLLYNIMIAYMITQRPGDGVINLLLIASGIILHFVVINLKIAGLHGELYDKYTRWIASSGLLLGWALGIITEIPKVVEITLFSFTGGIITYVALKNELAHTKNRAPFHFLAGAVIYSLIILAVPYFGHG